MKKDKKIDLEKKEIENKAIFAGTIGMLFLTLIFYIAEIAITGETNYGLFALICIFNGLSFGYRAIKYDKYRKVNAIASILWLLTTVICIYQYFDYLKDISEIL